MNRYDHAAEAKPELHYINDPAHEPPSLVERKLLIWAWTFVPVILAVLVVASLMQSFERTLFGAIVVGVVATIVILLGRTRLAILGVLIAILLIGFDRLNNVWLPGHIINFSRFALIVSSIVLAGLGFRRQRWAIPVVLASLIFPFAFSVYNYHRESQILQSMLNEFPFVDMKKRLEYEQSAFVGADLSNMHSEFHERGINHQLIQSEDLDLLDYHWYFRNWPKHATGRQENLSKLHNQVVREFIAMPDVGIARMVRQRVRTMSSLKLDSILIDDSRGFWPESRSEQSYGYTQEDDPEASSSTNRWQMSPLIVSPQNSSFLYHFTASQDFLDSFYLGFTNQNRESAGFVEHGFHFPPPGIVIDGKQWKLVQLQLVSIDRFNEARAYVLEELPRMDKLSSENVPTRKLNRFETNALKKLFAGEQLIVDNNANQLQMFGALRNRSSCMQCHSGKKGDLLGAFTYEFSPWKQRSHSPAK